MAGDLWAGGSLLQGEFGKEGRGQAMKHLVGVSSLDLKCFRDKKMLLVACQDPFKSKMPLSPAAGGIGY